MICAELQTKKAPEQGGKSGAEVLTMVKTPAKGVRSGLWCKPHTDKSMLYPNSSFYF
jgi:hypothetical protein